LSAVPNPLDPLSMPNGTAVMITGQALRGSTLEVGWKLLRVATDHTELEGMGFGVRRGEGSIVEVFSGPVSSVENELFLGLGRGSLRAGVTVGTTSESLDLSVARIDLSTEEGRAAYQAFITSGRVPDWNPPGVLAAGDQDVYNSEHEAWIGFEAGPLSVGWGGTNSQYNIVETQWQDGTVEQTSTYTLFGVTSEVSFPRGADGQPIDDQTSWRLMVPDSHPALASYVYSAYNIDQTQRDYDGEQHIQYTFTSDELMALRNRARDYVRDVYGEHGVEQMERIDRGEWSPLPSEVMMSIATAKTPDEVFVAIEREPQRATETLLAMAMEQRSSVPGRVEIRDAGD
jgi:hypothetical protein